MALDDVELSIAPGEVVALAGENGSGKSTLAKLLAGVLRPDRGELVVDGQPCEFAGPREALDAGIALVAQEPTAVPQLSVAENVLLGDIRNPRRRFRRRAQQRAAVPLLAAVGLEIDPARPFASLSSGERELAEVAKALAARPRLLVLDEATSRLPDPERLFEVVERLREDGVSTVFITHRLSEIRRLADRAVVLRDGRLVGEVAGSDMTDERLSTMMVGRDPADAFRPGDREEPGRDRLLVESLVVGGAARPASLAVRAGEVVGLAGLMGAGRTELLETIAGVRRCRGGSVSVDGRRVRGGSIRHALAAGIALVPEDRMTQGIVPAASISDNLALRPAPPLLPAPRRRERIDAQSAIDRLGIRAAGVEAPLRTLSGGNQQKVVLARALAHRPRVLLLDEPTRGIDVGARFEIYAVIDRLVQDGVAVVVASSELLELLGLCDRILVLHERAIAGELARDDATEERLALLSAGGRLVGATG